MKITRSFFACCVAMCLCASTHLLAMAARSPVGSSALIMPRSFLAEQKPERDLQALEKSLVRVNVTAQAFDFLRPWAKKAPSMRRGLGVIIGENRVLVTGDLVANGTFYEFEKAAGGSRTPAKVIVRDYDANLAILAPEDPAFLAGFVPLALDSGAKVGDTAEIIQLEPSGTVAETSARVSTITMGPYSVEDLALLIYRLTAPIQQRDASFTLPVVREGRLLGLLIRYDARNQIADIIPAQSIRRFLDAEKTGNPAVAFPRAGIGFAPLLDPQFREFLGIRELGGVYVTRVAKESAAEKSGIKPGDVILSINGKDIDSDGNFTHPVFGRMPLSYLITGECLAGDCLPVKIWRQGKVLELPLILLPRDRSRSPVPLVLNDTQPAYEIAGGLVFQELSRPMLYEWGPDWRSNAPQRLVYLDAFQDELLEPGKRVVVLTQVFPTDATLGYEPISNTIVTAIDGKPIASIEDLRAALAAPGDSPFRIELADDPRVIFLGREEAAKANEVLREQYGLPLRNE
jgi:S1-C subfamily serine protease